MHLLELVVLTQYEKIRNKVTVSAGAFSHFKSFQKLWKKAFQT